MLCKPPHEKQSIKMIESADSTSKDMSKATNNTNNDDPALMSSPEFSSATATKVKAKQCQDPKTSLQN